MSNKVSNGSQLKIHGIYRGICTENNIEGNKYGAIRINIPELCTEFEPNYGSEKYGLIAYPKNNAMGGYSSENPESSYSASLCVPLVGSYVQCEFENGSPDSLYYLGPWTMKGCEVPPENQGVEDPAKVYLLGKSGDGRSVILCDSPDEARTEITGKRHMLSGGGAGNSESSYTITGNMNTIIISEKNGNEKILIANRSGDFINFDVTNRMIQISCLNDIRISTQGKLQLSAGDGIIINTKSLNVSSSGGNTDITSEGNLNLTQTGDVNIKADGNINLDSCMLFEQSGQASTASKSIAIPPVGGR